MRRLHRWLGFGMAAFWLLQALTGILLVFRWEIDDAMLAGPSRPADPAALGARIESIARDGGSVVDVWASSGSSVRFDVYYRDGGGADRVMRVDGAGTVLRDGRDHESVANGGIFNTLTRMHSELLAGDLGRWLVGASGVLLLTHLVAGLHMAWPVVAGWKRALLARPAGSLRSRLLGWHRMTGLWAALVALPLVCAGVLLAFEHEIEAAIARDPVNPQAAPPGLGVGPGAAIRVALDRHKGAALSMLEMPTAERAWYRIRVRRPDDMLRNWGTTTLFVSATDASLLAEHPASAGNAGRKFIKLLHPFHTGQMGGLPGRAAIVAVGAWLLTMIVLGLRLRRARLRAATNALVPESHRARQVL